MMKKISFNFIKGRKKKIKINCSYLILKLKKSKNQRCRRMGLKDQVKTHKNLHHQTMLTLNMIQIVMRMTSEIASS